MSAIIHPVSYPEEYIRGKTTFFGRDFVVTPDVLIPRLETESLVRRARSLLSAPVMSSEVITESRHLAQGQESSHRSSGFALPNSGLQIQRNENSVGDIKNIVVDIGCGSGIIGTSVADLADEMIFLDISPAALDVTETNFRTHFPLKKAQFIVSDLLSNLPEFVENTELLFVTNLPYIKADDWIHMSADTVHEPRLALFGGEQTGFEMYERLFTQIAELELTDFQLLYEFGFDQREIAETVLQKYPQWEYSFFADYAGVERFGEITI